MASDVDICNLALAHLGDEASVSSINPPDQSAQAAYCSCFYPIALGMVLSDHTWEFSTRQSVLAQITNNSSLWLYCYALPSDFMGAIALYYYLETDDLNGLSGQGSQLQFSVETSPSGAMVLYTNQYKVLLKYASTASNIIYFNPLFIEALSWRLASYLAGPILKGDIGVSASKTCIAAYVIALKAARESDSQDRVVYPNYIPSGIRSRA